MFVDCCATYHNLFPPSGALTSRGAWRDVEPSWGVFGAFCKRSSFSWSFFTSPLCLMYLPLKSHSLDWFNLLFLDRGSVCQELCSCNCRLLCLYLCKLPWALWLPFLCILHLPFPVCCPSLCTHSLGKKNILYIVLYYPIQKRVLICLRHTHTYSSGDSPIN